MAQVQKNIIVQGISGKFGGQVVFRQMRDGRTILAAVPDFSKRVLSTDQKAHHSKFRAGAAYAKQAAKTTPLYAQLAAGTSKTAYNIALADFFHVPIIHEVKQVGLRLRIWASDTVFVSKVVVTVLDAEENILETGDAVQADADWWEYDFVQTGKVMVEAHDLAGNVGRVEKILGEGNT